MNLFTSRAATVALLSLVMIQVGCSKGGGSSSGSSGGGGGSTSGAMTVPNATCGNNPCVSGSSAFTSDSSQTVITIASDLYTHFNAVTIPAVNSYLKRIDQAFTSNGIMTCEAAAAVSPTTNYDLGGGYTTDIAAGDIAVPTGFVDAGTMTSRKFTLKLNGTAMGVVQVHCSAPYAVLYARIHETASNVEVWSLRNTLTTQKFIHGAIDTGSSKRTFYFASDSAASFQMLAVANNISYGGQTVSVAVGGNVALTSNVADISIALTNTTAPHNVTRSAANPTWNGASDIHHCYSSLSNGTVDSSGAACTSAAPATVPVARPLRGLSFGDWTVQAMSTPISTTF